MVWFWFYIKGLVWFQGTETEPNRNRTGPIALHIHEVSLTPYNDKEDVGTIFTSKTDVVYIIYLKIIVHGGVRVSPYLDLASN